MLPILSTLRNIQSGLSDPRFRNKLCRNSWVWGVKNSGHKNVCSVLLQKPTYLSSLERDSVCMRRHPPLCSVSWGRQDWLDPLCLPPACTLPFLDHLPTPLGNTQGLASLWVEGVAGKPQLSLLGEKGSFYASGTGLSRGGKPATVNRVGRYRSNPTQDAR